jgi:aminoglycoside phosphotransferase
MRRAPLVDDPVLPAARHLLSGDGADLLGCAVAAWGGDLRASRRAQVLYRRASSLVVCYDAVVSWARRAAQRETLLAGVGRDGAPAGTVALRAGDLEVGVWRYPFDPELPGLAAATGDTLDDLVGPVIGAIARRDVVTYRPCRRAVVRVDGRRASAYVKVVSPRAVTALVARHELLATTLPVPPVLAVDAALGLVVLGALPGLRLREHLRAGGAASSGHGMPPSLLTLHEQLARAAVPPWLGEARGPIAALPTHVDLLRSVTSGVDRDRLDRVHDCIAASAASVASAASDSGGRRQLVHGDLHEGQLLVDGARLTGVLDVDDAGIGDPLDDHATLVGHLAVLGLEGPHTAWIERCAQGHASALVARYGEREVARRVAAVVVALATGPFRVQQPRWRRATGARLALAARWLERCP